MARLESISITLVGCGKMGSGMVHGWLNTGLIKQINILEPAPLPDDLTKHEQVHHTRTVTNIGDADIIVLAVKPQVMNEVCETIKPLVYDKTLIISIAAGQSLASFEAYFDVLQPVIRAMPNTPAAIGKGMTVAIGNSNVTPRHRGLADILLAAIGEVEWASDEGVMDAVTALSGSGPAYVYLLMEVMAKAGEKCGLDERFAMSLARQTMIGAAALAEKEKDIPAKKLRENVTSPGGTTEAALKVLNTPALQKLFDKGLKAATEHGKKLNSKSN